MVNADKKDDDVKVVWMPIEKKANDTFSIADGHLNVRYSGIPMISNCPTLPPTFIPKGENVKIPNQCYGVGVPITDKPSEAELALMNNPDYDTMLRAMKGW